MKQGLTFSGLLRTFSGVNSNILSSSSNWGKTMGGVCAGGTGKRNLEHGDDNKTSGFSGKLKTMKSFGKHKENSQTHAIGKYSGNPSYDYDSGELPFSFSSELKQSTLARTVATKVFFLIFLWAGLDRFK